MRDDEVRALARAGLEIGFHTLRHFQLPLLDDAALSRAVRDGRERLERASGGELTTVAYPHGKADPRVADAAKDAGFAFGFTSRWTPVEPGSDPLLLGRIQASAESKGHLALQLVRFLLS